MPMLMTQTLAQTVPCIAVWDVFWVSLMVGSPQPSYMAGCVVRRSCICRGFIGAIGFTPMDFILPQFLWIAAYKPKGPK